MSATPSGDRETALVVALSAGSVAGGLFLPLSLVYFTVLTDIPLTVLGGLVTLAGVVTLPLPVMAGWLIDRHGAHRLVIAAQALQAGAYLAFVVVREPTGVFLAAAAMAVGSRLFWSSVFAFVADYADTAASRTLESWFATVNVTRTVGIVSGGLISGFVVSTGDARAYVGVAWAAAGFAAASAVALLRVRVRPRRRTDRPNGSPAGYAVLLRDRRFAWLLVTNVVFALSTLALGLTLPTLVRSALDGPGWLTSALLVTNAAAVAVLGRRGGVLAARLPSQTVLRAAGLVWAAAFCVTAIGATQSLRAAASLLLLAVLLLSVAEVLHAPTSASLVNAMAGQERRGRYLAVFQYSFVGAELIGPLLFTSLFDVGHALPFLALAALNLLTVPALAATRRVTAVA